MMGVNKRKCIRSLGPAIVAAAVAVLLVLGCQHVSGERLAPVLTIPPDSSTTTEQLATGRRLYISEYKCARCHSPKPIKSHTADEWANKILPKMAKKANLTPMENDCLLAYVTAVLQDDSIQQASHTQK
jgi:hypothetical protein